MSLLPWPLTLFIAFSTCFPPYTQAQEVTSSVNPAPLGSTCTPGEAGYYDLGLHIASVFVLLVASALGVFSPVVLGDRGNKNGWFGTTFFTLKYFGTGIIISLAFCHLLHEAIVAFFNPCIGELSYPPTAPSIVMASMFVIWLVDFFGSRWIAMKDAETARNTPRHADPLSQSETPVMADMACCSTKVQAVESFDGASRRAHWDVNLLEGGIVFHSIMIGVSLGAQTKGFKPTFAALVFHQLFEGLGLGSRIGMLIWPPGIASILKKYSLCLAYTLVTPGIGVHQSFNENGRSELLAIGILNSISAGILLYGGLCQLLYAEWVVGEMRGASGRKIGLALGALVAGMIAMGVIGKWT
ncbi:hypothetical protein L198_06144 [Cryptococcus wingfieldii CBS 7118]|uniref:Solute carrier family 39 (Zinc transporter), member 1/2/3 n=1 Tax=Cryptococcus wingfieldii CBS 7118 TaxID=1295528 RepID=A0A1E3IQE6_9TREE|nr:hypothetical protein L198_06144 [Cryptococcus wingfieldii CBS 7118]ODN90827.1 hypothetical protein L198_06144 [Cryptococcus wingfieldii CBS 7118]